MTKQRMLALSIFFLFLLPLLCASCKKQSEANPPAEEAVVHEAPAVTVKAEEKPALPASSPEPYINDAEWKIPVSYSYVPREQLVTELAPGVQEGDIRELLHVYRFTPEELGERLKSQDWGNGKKSVVIFNEDMETAFFARHKEVFPDQLYANYREKPDRNICCEVFRTENYIEDNRNLFVIKDLTSGAITECIVIDSSAYGDLYLTDSEIKYGGDREQDYLFVTRRLPYDGEFKKENESLFKESFRPVAVPGLPESYGLVYSSEDQGTVMAVSEEMIPYEGLSQYWFQDGSGYWIPGSKLYVQTGCFENLPRKSLPYDSIVEETVWLSSNEDALPVSRTFADDGAKPDMASGSFFVADKIIVCNEGGADEKKYYHLTFPVTGYVCEDDVTASQGLHVKVTLIQGRHEAFSITPEGKSFTVRAMPFADSEIVAELPKKWYNASAETEDGWYYIHSDDGVSGWVYTDEIFWK